MHRNGVFWRAQVLYRTGAPRSMKMGTTYARWHNDIVPGTSPRSANAHHGRHRFSDHCRSLPTRDGAIAASTDASCRFATDSLHEGLAERADWMGIGNVRRFRKI